MDMRVSNISSPTFSSRNKTIRFADDIARHVNKEFPRVSQTLAEGLNNADKFPNLMGRLKKNITEMRDIKYDAFERSKDFKTKLLSFVVPIKVYKKGNCGESAELTMLMAKANGIQNCKKCSLKTPKGRSYDHAVVLVEDKKPYIIDAWLGFADYVPNAIKRYQGEFRQHFDFKGLKTEKMVVQKGADTYYSNKFLNQKFTKKNLETLKKGFPSFVIKKNNKK